MLLALGVTAGIATAVSWALSGTINAASSRMLGVHRFMMLRQPVTLLALCLFCLLSGQFHAYTWQATLLALVSGAVGVALCDWLLYESILRAGIRPAMVCHSLYVCCTALLGMLLLDETLGLQGAFGIGIATCGVIMVITSEKKHAPTATSDARQRRVGLVMALLSAVTMALGFVLSKQALQQGIPPLMLTLMRNVMACVLVWSTGIWLHRTASLWQDVRARPEVIKLLLLGCLFGAVGGTWLSMTALAHAPTAVASTLIGLQPVALLLVSGLWERRCPSLGSIVGSCIACAGAAILLLR